MPLSPWLDMDATGETFETNAAKDLIVTRDLIQGMAGTFLGEGGNRRDPLANPLRADLKGFPPIYIQTGADETLLDDSRKLADLARKTGVEVTLEIVPEMQHVFQFLAGTAPEAVAAIRRLADWVRPKLGLRLVEMAHPVVTPMHDMNGDVLQSGDMVENIVVIAIRRAAGAKESAIGHVVDDDPCGG